MAVVGKRTAMTLYSDVHDIDSHRVRIVLAEKGINVDIHSFRENEDFSQAIASLNPYGFLPILLDRELVLYEPRIIMEYLDERFPHPPLLPVYPVARAEARKMVYRIERDWYSLLRVIEKDQEGADEARQRLIESLTSVAPVFASKPYFLHDDFSLLDCCIAPLLWRLPRLDIVLPEAAAAVQEYAERIFKRNSFQVSLTEMEREETRVV